MAERIGVKIKSPELGARKLLERARVARPFYIYGVQNPKVSPTEAAIAMKDTWRQIMSRTETVEKWAANRAAVGDVGWLAGILGKGADRYVPGVEFGIGKYLDFASEFYPYLEKKLPEIKRMPKVTIEDSINRAAAMIRHNHAFHYKKKPFSLSDLEGLKSRVLGVSLPT